MNPMYIKVALSLLRYGLIAVGAGGIVSDDQLTQAAGAATTLGTLLWSVWKNYKEQQKLVTAMSGGPVTERQVEAMVRAGEAPSVTTPKSEVPV